MTIGLGTVDKIVNGGSIGGRHDDESCSGVKDGSAALEAGVLSIDGGSIHSTFPEALRVDVGQSHQGRRIKLGVIKPSKVVKSRIIRFLDRNAEKLRTYPKVISPSLRLSARRGILKEVIASVMRPAFASDSGGVRVFSCDRDYIGEEKSAQTHVYCGKVFSQIERAP